MRTLFLRILLPILLIAPLYSQSKSDEIGLVYRVCNATNDTLCATAPRAISTPNPNYTDEARRKNIQGTVTLAVIVDANGNVKKAEVSKSLDPGLDEQAIEAVKRWTFHPAESNGKPVAVRIKVEVNFKLFGGPGNSLPPTVSAYDEKPSAEPSSSEILSRQDLMRTYSEAYQAEATHEYRKSIALANQVAAKLPQHGEVWNLLGLDYLALGELPDAESAFLRQIEVNPRTLYAYNNLGRAYLSQKKYDEAAANFRKQIEINPQDAYAHTNLALALYQLSRYQDALASLDKAASITPSNSEIPFVRGECLLELGKTAEALKSFDNALAITPTPPVWNSVSWTLAKHNVELGLAEQYAQSAVSAMTAILQHASLEHVDKATFGRPASLGAYWDTLGYIKMRQGNLPAAQSYLEAAWQLEQRPDIGTHIGELYEKLGRVQDARSQYALTMAGGEKIEHKTKDDADALRFAEDRLKTLVSDPGARDKIMDKARAEWEKIETITVANPAKNEGTSDVAILISKSGVSEVKALEADSKLAAVVGKPANWSIVQKMPGASTIQIVRRGDLVCHSSEPTCRLKLLSTDEAARKPLPVNETAVTGMVVAKKPAVQVGGQGGKLSGRNYSSEMLGLQMVLPEDWILVSERGPAPNVPGMAMFGKPGALAFLVVAKERLEATPETYIKLMKAGLQQKDNYQELGESSIERDGLAGVRWNCKWEQQGVAYHSVVEVFSSGDQHYRLFATAPDDMFERYAHDLDEALRSVKFPALHISAKDLPDAEN